MKTLVLSVLALAGVLAEASPVIDWKGSELRIVDANRQEALFRIPGARLMLPSFAADAKAKVQTTKDGIRVVYAHPLLESGEAVLRQVPSGLALTASFVPKKDVVLNRLDVFPKGTRTSCYELKNFKTLHATSAVWPQVLLGGNGFAINTYSKDWQFAPHPTAMLFTRNPAQVVVGATCAPVGGYGLYAEGKKSVLDGFWLDYGADEWGWTVKAGETWQAPEFRIVQDDSNDPFRAWTKFGEVLIAEGFIADPKKRPYYPWHYDHVYCTWHDQTALSGYVPDADLKKQSEANPSVRSKSWIVLTEKLVRDAADIIEREKLPFKTILIDGGWMLNTMDFRAAPDRFPDFRGLVDDLHKRGFKVVVWWTWSEIRDAGCEQAIGVHNTMLNGKRNCHKRMMADFSKKSAQEEYLRPLMRRLFSSESGCYDLDGVKTDYQADKIHPDLPAEDPSWRGEENYFRRLYALFTSEMRRYKPDACHIGCAGNYFLAEYIDMNRTYDVSTDNPEEHENRAKMLAATAPGVQPVWDLPTWTDGNWSDYVEALKRRHEPVHIGRLFKMRDRAGATRDLTAKDFARYRQLEPSAREAVREKAVNVDVGRQLFVDDELVSSTTLKRVWHHPKKYEGNPVMKPETPWELNAPNNATVRPNGGGLWWDAKEQVFKLWYEGGWLHTVCYATSKDGIRFERPTLDVVEGTNIVLPTNNPAYRPDSWSVVKDPNPKRPDELYKLLLHRPWVGVNSAPEGVCAVSPDGIHWRALYPLPASGDRSSLYFNPFTDEWVYSIRSSWKNPGEKHGRRNRSLFTQMDFTKTPEWYWRGSELGLPRWLQADERDAIDPSVADPKKFPKTQLYNFDAVAYESLMLGLFEIHLGPENGECEAAGLPKITDIKFGFSRREHDFKRYDFEPAIASERWGSDKWDAGYVQPLANGCVIVWDELYFYYGAFRGEPKRANTKEKKYDWTLDNGMYANAAMGLAKLRRDGFASMEGTGELLTKPLQFSGEYLFVNADARAGAIAAELVDKDGKVVEGYAAADSRVEAFDATKKRLVWKTRDRLNVRKFDGHRLRFTVENAALYSFWISLSPEGESNGYLAGGGPGYEGLRDVPKAKRPVVAPTICAPQALHARTGRKHEGIPSIAVSKKGTMWATWYAGPTPYEDEYNYLVLSKSTDGGKTWTETLVCDPDGKGPRRAFDPEIWLAPDGKLRWTWTDKLGPCPAVADNDQLWMATLDPETGAVLEAPRVIAKGVMMNKPTVLRDGTWILPVAHWWVNPSSCCYASTDGGRTFEYRGGVSLPRKIRGFDEHTILERKDGSLVCYIRTFNAAENCLFESESRDGGRTWSEAKPALVANCSSRTFVTKLRNGRWLMVKHDGYSKVIGRERLTALLSEDDGRTWWGGLLLDVRKGCSYPDGQELEDGSIVVVNDYDRTGKREISFVRFRPEEVIRGGTPPARHIISIAPDSERKQ